MRDERRTCLLPQFGSVWHVIGLATIMSTQKNHKRKRSIQDTPVEPTKMQLARRRLSALQEELSGIEETKTENRNGGDHEARRCVTGYSWQCQEARELNRKILVSLVSRTHQKISFSSVQRSDLSSMGLERKPFRFNDAALEACIAASGVNSKHIEALCLQITRIHRSVSMRVSPTLSRMERDGATLVCSSKQVLE